LIGLIRLIELIRGKAEGRRQKAEGRRQKAEGRRQKAEGRRQKAEGRRQKYSAVQDRLLISKVREPFHVSRLTFHDCNINHKTNY
jgi:uncharacterized protein YjbJ (UPF0337 family)